MSEARWTDYGIGRTLAIVPLILCISFCGVYDARAFPGRGIEPPDRVQDQFPPPVFASFTLSVGTGEAPAKAGDDARAEGPKSSTWERLRKRAGEILAKRAPFIVVLGGTLAAKVGAHEIAVRLYSLAIDSYGADNPDAATPIALRAGSLSGLGRPEEALADKDRLVRIRPDDAFSYESRGLTLWGLKRYPEALRDYDSARRIDPKSLSVNMVRAMLLRRLGKLDEAREACSRVIEINSHFAWGYSLRGTVFHELRDYRAAIADYTSALRLRPSPRDYYHRGLSYHELGAYDFAVVDYSRALAIGTRSSAIFYARGNLYLELGKYKEALADYTHAIELNGSNVSAYVNRAIAYGKLDRVQEALADYEEALRLNRNHANAYANRGWLYEQLGRADSARLDYARALRLAPDDTWLQRALMRVGGEASRRGAL